jgi:selenide,water dikinase
MDDAALLRPESGPGLVFTVDFITPVVDEPEAFGAIAAANALSDVYAMGGEPMVALAVAGFPDDKLPKSVLERIFRGGRDKCAEAGCAIVGGHTVLDPELKYGLAVLGKVDAERALVHTGGRAGDALVLTKPIGLGVTTQALKAGRLSAEQIARAIALMTTLNRGAKDAALACGARAATDVTGFGLLGHLHNLASASGVSARVTASSVPMLDFARDLAQAGVVPGGTKRNQKWLEPKTRWAAGLDDATRVLLCDAQTSGGLLIAVARARAPDLVAELGRRGTPAAAIVGELVAGEAGAIEVRA